MSAHRQARQQQQAAAAKLYGAGHSIAQIAEKMGVGKPTLYRWKRLGEWVRGQQPRRENPRLAVAYALFAGRRSQREIAHLLNVSEKTVSYWQKRHGWVKRRALAADSTTRQALLRLGALVAVEAARCRASQQAPLAGELEVAFRYVCKQLEQAELADLLAGLGDDAEPDAPPAV